MAKKTEKVEEKSKLQDVLNELNKKYGQGAVIKGTEVKPFKDVVRIK